MGYWFGVYTEGEPTPVRTRTGVDTSAKLTSILAGTYNDDGMGALQAGDCIELSTGVTYAGNFVLPAVSGASASTPLWLRVAGYASAFTAGVRVANTDSANLALLRTNNGNPVLAVEASAAFWRLQGLNLTNDHTVFVNILLQMRDSPDGDRHATRPLNFTFTHCWIHEYQKDNPGYVMGIAGSVGQLCVLSAANFTFTDCRFAGGSYQNEFDLSTGHPSYAVTMVSDNDNHSWTNCYLESYFAAVFTGGGTSYPSRTATLSNLSVAPAWTDFTMASPDHATLTGYQLKFTPTLGGSPLTPATVIPIAATVYNDPDVTIREGLWPLTGLTLTTEYDVECRTVAAGPTYGSWVEVKTNWTYATHVITADLSTVAELSVGDVIALKTTGGRAAPTATAAFGALDYGCVLVTAINGTTVTMTPYGVQGYMTTGNPLLQDPDVPGQANLMGYMNSNLTFTRCQFHVDIPSHDEGNTAEFGYAVGKGHVETKNVDGLIFDACVFSGWAMTVFLSARNQAASGTGLLGGNPWCTSRDVTFQNCWWPRPTNYDRQYMHALAGPQLADDEFSSVTGGSVLLDNCLIGVGIGPDASMMSAMRANDVTWRHVTVPSRGDVAGGRLAWIYGPSDGVTFDSCIVPYGYGLQIDAPPSGQGTLANVTATKNVFLNNSSVSPSPATTYPLSYDAALFADIGFENAGAGNYRLAVTSNFKGLGTNGTDPGCDLDALKAALGPVLGADLP